MRVPELLITEIFHSIQGETSLSGIPFAFVRLTGCNLRCTYCDSAYSFKGGRRMSIAEVLEEVRPFDVDHVLLTGGEPLLQRPVGVLIDSLKSEGYQVSVETHGEISIQNVVDRVRIIMDVKTPSSGMSREGFMKNLPLLKKEDEVKFVIASEDDYLWAKDWVKSGLIPTREILFSPALPAKNSPGTFPGIDVTWLAEKILADRLPVRFQYQLHKLIWGADRRGV